MSNQQVGWWVLGGLVAVAGCTGNLFVGGDSSSGAGGVGRGGYGGSGDSPSTNHSKGGTAGIEGSSSSAGGGGYVDAGGPSDAGSSGTDSPGGSPALGGSTGGKAAGGGSGVMAMSDDGEGGYSGENPRPPPPSINCDCASSPALTLLECGAEAPQSGQLSRDGSSWMYTQTTSTGNTVIRGSWIEGQAPARVVMPEHQSYLMSDDGKAAILFLSFRHGNERVFEPKLWTEAEGDHDFPSEIDQTKHFRLSRDGVTVLGAAANSDDRALVFYTLAGGTALVDLSDALGENGRIDLHGGNSDLSVLGGGMTDETGQPPFVWRSSGLIRLGSLPSATPGSAPQGHVDYLSADGTVAVGVTRVGVDDTRFFRWTEAEGMTDIGLCRADASGPFGSSAQQDCLSSVSHPSLMVSDDGKVIAGTMASDPSLPTSHAVRRTEDGSVVELTPNTFSMIYDMSARGDVVVGYFMDSNLKLGETFLWDEVHGARALTTAFTDAGVDLSGWTLGGVSDVSDDGNVMLGYGQCGENPALFRAVVPN